jgi:hypothetical protein
MAAASAAGGTGAEYSGSSASAEFSVTDPSAQENVVVKIGMVGDAGVGQASPTALSRLHGPVIIPAGKTSLMVKYVEGSFDEVPMQRRAAALQYFTTLFRITSKRLG